MLLHKEKASVHKRSAFPASREAGSLKLVKSGLEMCAKNGATLMGIEYQDLIRWHGSRRYIQ